MDTTPNIVIPSTIKELNDLEVDLISAKAGFENCLDSPDADPDMVALKRRSLRAVKAGLEALRLRRGALKAAQVEARSKARERLILNSVRILYPAELEAAIEHAKERHPDVFSGAF